MEFLALFEAVLSLFTLSTAPEPEVAELGPRQKAALVVVSGPPAPRGVAGVFVHGYEREGRRPDDAVVFVDQEGGEARAFPNLPPERSASSFTQRREAFLAGLKTGKGLRRAGVHVDLAPVLDVAGGPLGARHFDDPAFGLAFARGLAAGGVGACVKHFPGLGSTDVSTDESTHVRGRLVANELRTFRAAIRAGAPCVMVAHAYYGALGRHRASFEPRAYRLLRRSGFDGVAITDSVSVFGSDEAVLTARLAIRAGADLVLLTNGADAARAIAALVPLARKGVLDERIERVVRFRRSLGLPGVPRW